MQKLNNHLNSVALLVFILACSFPVNSYAQSVSSNSDLPIFGTLKFDSPNDLPDQMRLAPELTALVKKMVDATKNTEKEYAACIDDKSTGSWTIGDLLEGDQFSVDTRSCSRSNGLIHTHPPLAGKHNNVGHIHSGSDFATFMREIKKTSIVVSEEGVCALLHGGKGDKPWLGEAEERKTLFARYALAGYAYSTSATQRYQSVFESVARAAAPYGAVLYCGATDGNLRKVQPNNVPTDITDTLMAKSLMIMFKARTKKDWPAIDFKFTPELDEDFIAYTNKALGYKPDNPYVKVTDTPGEVVWKIVSIARANLGLNREIAFPNPINLRDNEGALVFTCRTTFPPAPVRFGCLLGAHSPVLTDKKLQLAFYFAPSSHMINEYPDLKLDNFSALNANQVGIGYIENEHHVYRGEVRNSAMDGQGEITLKETGKRYKAIFSNNQVVKASPLP